MNQPSPRKELLHNIDPLEPPIGKRVYPDSFDNRFRAAIRVGDMKLLTGSVGKIKMSVIHDKCIIYYIVTFQFDFNSPEIYQDELPGRIYSNIFLFLTFFV